MATVNYTVMGSRASASVPSLSRRTQRSTGVVSKRTVTKAGDTQVIMSVANGAALALGRFGFLSYQRRKVAEAGMPKQNDETHLEAGDYLAKEATVFETKDPAGFTLIDTIAWGSLGHIIGFAALAAKNANELGISVSPNW